MGRQRKSGFVRIIGGAWRGRRLPVLNAPGLRPSGDRVRETLFNWLQGSIEGARCADLYAGTGALGLEAASRGAREVILVERAQAVAEQLEQSVELLNAAQATVVRGDALAWLNTRAAASLDLVFVDPPFGSSLEAPTLKTLHSTGCLASGALVYVESAADAPREPQAGFVEVRNKCIGDVHMRLLGWH